MVVYRDCFQPLAVFHTFKSFSLTFSFIVASAGPDPEHSNTGGGIECPSHDVSGVSRKGGEYERGLPPSHIGGSGISPGKIWEIVVPEKRS